MRTRVQELRQVNNANSMPVRNKKTGNDTVALNGNIASQEGNIDALNINVTALNGVEKEKLNNIYKKLEAICEKHDININLAKSERLLERIAGVTSKELIKMSDDEINSLVEILNNSLGWGDGLGFGEKDAQDLNKLIKDIHIKMGFKQTNGSKFGQFLHNTGNRIKGFFGKKTVAKCKTPEEISQYYSEKYLKNINTMSEEDKVDAYQKLLEHFFYDFNSLKEPDKQVNMIKAIENLAANDRLTMVKVIERCFSDLSPLILATFGKILDENFESIVLSRDALGNIVTKMDATSISHTAFSHMSEDDINNSLMTHKLKAEAFYQENSEKIKELRLKRDKGVTLTPEELDILEKSEIYFEAKYAGAMTGTSCNINLEEASKCNILQKVANDTAELGIQEEVLKTVSNFIKNNPKTLNETEDAFVKRMDKATNGNYSKVLMNNNHSNSNISKVDNQHSNKPKIPFKKEDNKENNPFTIEISEYGFLCEPTVSPVLKVNKNKNKLKPTGRLIDKPAKERKNLIKHNYKRDNLEDNNKAWSYSSLQENSNKNIENIQIVANKGLGEIKKLSANSNISEVELTIELLSLPNVAPDVEEWAFSTFETFNESQKALYCSNIRNNDNKIKAGKLIKSMAALKQVKCNNTYVKKYFENLIAEREEKERLSLNTR